MIRTETYTAKLSKSSHQNLDDLLEKLRVLYNAALEERIDAYRKTGQSPNYVQQAKSLTEIRNSDLGYDDYRCAVQQNLLKRLEKAYQHFFRRGGFPRFKSHHRGIRSFEWHNPAIRKHGKFNVLLIKGVGRLRFKGELPDQIRFVRVVKTARRVKLQIIHEIADAEPAPSISPIGIDVGIRSRITCSNGFKTGKNELDRSELKRRQRILSKAVKGSNNRRKKRLALAKEWQRVRERERGSLHELTAELAKQSNTFYVENLNVLNMVKNHKLARSILEANWGAFIQMLTYKAESAGGTVVKVDPKDTSQKCSSCGTKAKEKLTLAIRQYRCEYCGFEADRDMNAAMNILQRGLGLSSKSGGNSPARRENATEGSALAGSTA